MDYENLERVHIFSKSQSSVNSWDMLGEDDDFVYLIPPKTVIKVQKNRVHKKKKEAQYELFAHKLINGNSKVQNFKGSKYYEYYLERATKENPELLI